MTAETSGTPTIVAATRPGEDNSPTEGPSLAYGGYVPLPTGDITYPPYALFAAATDGPAPAEAETPAAATKYWEAFCRDFDHAEVVIEKTPMGARGGPPEHACSAKAETGK